MTWSSSRTLIIGTGALAASGLGTLRSRGADVVGVFSPSGRAEDFGELYGLPPVSLTELSDVIATVDVVLACSSGESSVLMPALIAHAISRGPHQITVIDLALHRDVAPGVAEMRGVTVVDLADVAKSAPNESPDAIDAERSSHTRSRSSGTVNRRTRLTPL